MRSLSLPTAATGSSGAGMLESLPILRWVAVARERRALAGLSDRALADIGLDPAAARREAARPFWDLPKSRR